MTAYGHPDIFTYKSDSEVGIKITDPATLKTVIYPHSQSLMAEKIDVDRLIAAAQDLSDRLIRHRFDEMSTTGHSEVNPAVCVNYNGTMFTVTPKMSTQDAKQAFNDAVEEQKKEQRQRRIEELGLHDVNASPSAQLAITL